MRRFLVKLLARDVGFRDAMIEHFTANKPSVYKENMEFAFKDSQGRRYFIFRDPMKMPLAMTEKLQELQANLEAKIPAKDLDGWIKAVETDLSNDNRKDKVLRMGYWLSVLKERREVLFDPTILLEIAALIYIREDEDPTVYNKERHIEKYQMFWDDSREGKLLYDFFTASGLKAFMPSGGVTAENWATSLDTIMQKIQAFNSKLTAISTSASNLETEPRNTGSH